MLPHTGGTCWLNWTVVTYLEMIEWLFLSHQPQQTITTYITVLCQLTVKDHDRVIQLFGHDPAVIHVPLTQVYLQQLHQS